MLTVYTTTRLSLSEDPVEGEVIARVPLDDESNFYTHYMTEHGRVVELPFHGLYIRIAGVDSSTPLDPPLKLTILEDGKDQPPGTLLIEMPNGTEVAIKGYPLHHQAPHQTRLQDSLQEARAWT